MLILAWFKNEFNSKAFLLLHSARRCRGDRRSKNGRKWIHKTTTTKRRYQQVPFSFALSDACPVPLFRFRCLFSLAGNREAEMAAARARHQQRYDAAMMRSGKWLENRKKTSFVVFAYSHAPPEFCFMNVIISKRESVCVCFFLMYEQGRAPELLVHNSCCK